MATEPRAYSNRSVRRDESTVHTRDVLTDPLRRSAIEAGNSFSVGSFSASKLLVLDLDREMTIMTIMIFPSEEIDP
jgi:hypothetical protein